MVGNEASGLTQVMIQFAPGKTQSLHRHPGEAWLYVVEGYGHSFMGTAPDKGEHHRWKKGDLIVVDHFLRHQHFNDDPKNQCPLVRIHMFDSILETMRAITDPVVLFEEAEDTLVSMQELSQIRETLPGYRVTTWYSFVAPKDSPKEAVEPLNREINEVLKEPDVVAALHKRGLEPDPMTPEELAHHFDTEAAKWAKVARDAHIRPE